MVTRSELMALGFWSEILL